MYEAFYRNLARTRPDSNGYLNIENSEAGIVAKNLVVSDFGIVNFDDVSYRHDLSL